MFKDLKTFLKKEYKVIIALFIITLLTYFIKIFFYSISIDTETMLLHPQDIISSWYSLGRFSLGLFKSIINLVCINITLTNITSILLIFLSSVTLIYSFYILDKKHKNTISYILLGSIFITSPYVVEQFNFTLQTVEISLCYLLQAISFIYINNYILTKKKTHFLISIILNILCIGAYQSFALSFICTAICFYLTLLKKEKWNFKEAFIVVLKYIIIFIISLILSQLVSKLFMYFLLHTTTINSYLSSQIAWKNTGIINSIKNIVYFAKNVLLGIGLVNLPYYFIMCIIVFIYSTYRLIKKASDLKKEYIPVLFLLISPFLLSFLTGGAVALRTLTPLSIVLGFLFFYILTNSKNNRLNKLVILLGIVVVIHQTITSLYLFKNDYKRYQYDVKLANEINKKLNDYDTNKPIVFIGYKSHLKNNEKGETIGASFFEWDRTTELGSNGRIHSFMNTLKIYNLKCPSAEQHQEALAYKDELKIFPADGSIKELDNYIIVKLSN